MNKHSLLSEVDMAAFVLDEALLSGLRCMSRESTRAPSELRILDYGCGRGRSVAKLRALGYDAFGVDVSSEPVNNGRPYFVSKGWDGEHILRVIGEDGRTDFPDGYFHYIFSQQVFEHVADLGAVCGEIARLTAPDGTGLHVFSAPRRLIEEHLSMPFVHWLPKGRLRHAWVGCCVLAGRDPGWGGLVGKGFRDRTSVYAEYSNCKTFYRSWKTVADAFGRCGIDSLPIVVERFSARGIHACLLRIAQAVSKEFYRRLYLSTLQIRLACVKRQTPGDPTHSLLFPSGV